MSEQLAAFRSARREIRGTEVIAADLACLQKNSKIKVPGTTLNAVGALIQQLAARDGNSDFVVFSSLLSPLISGKLVQGPTYGTIEGHILNACEGETKETLLTKARWLFPMFGDVPPHWILGYLELGAREFRIFDGSPELNSDVWAEPALVELAETVYAYLGLLDINLAPWKVHYESPAPLMRQMNGWACGFFAIHGMLLLARGESTTAISNEHTEEIKAQTLEMILSNLPLLTKATFSQATEPVPHVEELPVEQSGSAEMDIDLTDVNTQPATQSSAVIDAVVSSLNNTIDLGRPPVTLSDTEPPKKLSNLKRKSSSDTVGIKTETKKKKKRRPYLSESDRRAALEDNVSISAVEPYRVKCRGCNLWIQLDKKQTYKAAPWERHEGNCSQLSGTRKVRIAIKQIEKKPANVGATNSFFDKRPKRVEGLPSAASSSKASTTPLESDDDSDSSRPKIIYKSQVVFAPTVVPQPQPCNHLFGDNYKEYIERTETRSMGGISPTLRGRVARQILFYKKLGALKEKAARTPQSDALVAQSIPTDGNTCINSAHWTDAEYTKLDDHLQGYARWEVNFAKKIIQSTQCEGLTTNADQVCTACHKVPEDPSLQRSIRRKNHEASLPIDEQHDILLARNKYSGKRFADTEARKLQNLLKDPLVFSAFKELEKDEPTVCFIKLYDAARNGKLKKHETVTDLCKVVSEMLERDDTAKKYGMRYPARYLNFMILMRSYGGNSARQYGLLSGELPYSLQNPELNFENFARVKRLVDSIKYAGPLAVAGDCTKVRKRLTYSNDFGAHILGHILGSVLPLKECIVEDRADIDRVMKKVQNAKAHASQARAILIKIPLPQIPPIVVALLPTDGSDDAPKIVEQNLILLKMCAQLALPVISFAADGAASELAAQNLMDKQATPCPPVTYDYPLYGIHLRAPVMETTGPVVSNTDGFHARKTGRNQPQYGTKTQSMGTDVLVNENLVQLYETGESGILHSDVFNTDKQDDGPARRIFHYQALLACTTGDGPELKIRDGFGGLFVYLFILGNLFDAWINRTMTVQNRVLAVLRARFFLHFWREHIVHMSKKFPDLYSTARSFISPASFHIFNRLCDTLLLLVIIYSRYYPDQPFCPWLLMTDFVEHFFGLARMMLPNFTYAEFLKIIQHVMVRQRILLSGAFKEKRDRKANQGYVLDFDASPLTAEDRQLAHIRLTETEMNTLVEVAFQEASLICTEILHIPAPTPTVLKPIKLTALGAPPSKRKPGKTDEEDSDADDDADEDPEDVEVPAVQTEAAVLNLAAQDAARYSALCDDYEAAVKEAESIPAPVYGPHPPAPAPSSSPPDIPFASAPKSEFIIDGKLSIPAMVEARLHWQSGATTRGEKVVRIDSKYALSRIAHATGLTHDDDTEPEKMTLQEASNSVRVLQDLNSATHANKLPKYRELRWKAAATAIRNLVDSNGELFLSRHWVCHQLTRFAVLPNISAKNVHALNPLSVGTYTIVWNGIRFYVGEILDVYKRGASSRYGSVRNSISTSGLAYMSLRVYLPLTSVCPSSLNGTFNLHSAQGPAVTGDASESEVEEDQVPETEAPLFSSRFRGVNLYTHAKIEHLLFNLGNDAFERGFSGGHRALTPHAALKWMAFTKPKVQKEVKKLTITIRRPKAT
ncbi:hypothetical protein B0H16DRAFT_1762009 [Mycena metata]|uniref:Ubiquitin-like protease family profile domain-containing protein n=1 Tax=Mycena metata TaxID=1033252 RepID=A0AAD7IAY5_9AGAR|nr:hypothetical protein B0H16DRAFT_1762009 [Mycena metata]